jgi:cysteine desulfurase
MSELYFDHAASAPRRDEVSQAMLPWMHGVVGNPSGSHRAARLARKAVEDARDEIASLCGARPGNVVFTAGGTESCSLAVLGVARRHRRLHERSAVVTSAIEHHAVGDSALMLKAEGITPLTLGVDSEGVADLALLSEFLQRGDVALVSLMTANNETGVLQPVNAASALAREAGVLSHTDAVAAAPWIDLRSIDADLLSLCAHKIGGPVNAGALVMRGDYPLDALSPGGGQEKGRRGGTVDVAACVGLATALRCVDRERDVTNLRVTALRDQLVAKLITLPDCQLTAPQAQKVPGTVHVTFAGVASDELLFLLDLAGVCASAAASCSSGAAVSSHVLAAMGVEADRARGSLRLSFGAETTSDDVGAVVHAIAHAVQRLRPQSSSGR